MTDKRYNIFLAEDDGDDRDLFLLFLKDRTDIGDISCVMNGAELIEALNNSDKNNLPDMIIIDQNMPVLDGIKTLQHLKRYKKFNRIPVMVYSTYANEILTENALIEGAVMVAGKPTDKRGYNKMMDALFALI